MYQFTIRGQVFTFNSREAYLHAFSNALDIAKSQEYKEPPPDEQMELPLYKPPLGIELPQLEG
jgi:hypothetical protein